MKYLQLAAVVFVLYFLGYVLGPTISPMLVKEKEAKGELVKEVSYKGAVFPINLAEYRGDDLPRQLEIVRPVTIPTVDGEGEVRLVKGDLVTLLNRDGSQLIIEKAESNGKGAVKPDDTNIYEALAVMKFEEAVASQGGAVAGNPRPPIPAPQPQPEPVSQDPEPVAVVEPEPMPDPPGGEPVTNPDPEPEPAGATLGEEQIVELMKKSIAGGAVKEFALNQVTHWKATGEETVDGTTYQTGLAAYQAETIFGVRPVQAKALIKDGKVERWVYAKSGMEIQ